VKSIARRHRGEGDVATIAPESPLQPPPVQGDGAPDARVRAVADAFLVAEKPGGLLCVPGRGEAGRDCLLARLQQRWPELEVVHRLDMATSGLMVFARGKAAQRRLSMAFAAREVRKRYVALVDGRIAGDAGEVDLPLIVDWPQRPRQQVDLDRGKPSLTRWRVLQRHELSTRLELEPVTGRTHQLRVHLAAIGHPIVGDRLYAPPLVATAAPQLLLHASELAFEDPAGGERRCFVSAPGF
jgi:tRNA pseudouridine32 synthase/23S rRNA pseudouridine746 synthase